MSTTSLGIQISAGKIKEPGTTIDHYVFSSKKEIMSKEIAGILAELILRLRNLSVSCTHELITQNRRVFHLLICPLNAGDLK